MISPAGKAGVVAQELMGPPELIKLTVVVVSDLLKVKVSVPLAKVTNGGLWLSVFKLNDCSSTEVFLQELKSKKNRSGFNFTLTNRFFYRNSVHGVSS
jgi:hypothetical protein